MIFCWFAGLFDCLHKSGPSCVFVEVDTMVEAQYSSSLFVEERFSLVTYRDILKVLSPHAELVPTCMISSEGQMLHGKSEYNQSVFVRKPMMLSQPMHLNAQ